MYVKGKTTISPPLFSELTCQKDVSIQMWQATAKTNMMFNKLFINKSWQNYSEQILATSLQAVTSFRSHIKPFLTLTLLEICTHKSDDPFHRPKTPFNAYHLCQKTGNCGCDCNNSATILNKMSIRWGNNTFWSNGSYYRCQPVFPLCRPEEISFRFNLIWRNFVVLRKTD